MNTSSWVCANPRASYCKSPFPCGRSSWQRYPHVGCVFTDCRTHLSFMRTLDFPSCSFFCKSNYSISIGLVSIFNVLHFLCSERRQKSNSQGYHCFTWLLHFRKSTERQIQYYHKPNSHPYKAQWLTVPEFLTSNSYWTSYASSPNNLRAAGK